MPNRAIAYEADEADPLAFARDRFRIPEGVIYLDGNSLGPLPGGVTEAILDSVEREWGVDLIRSWNENGWWQLPALIGDRIGTLVGAAPGQIICGDSTTVQLFQVIASMARMRSGRQTILTDLANFPTDQYVSQSVARLLGLSLVRTSPDAIADTLGPDVAVVSFSAVDYRTGELWDMAGVTAAVQDVGAMMVWDLCHAVGTVPVDLDTLGVDAAVGCSYKYLNGGPGAPAWTYIAARHQSSLDLPLTGWQGHADPFALDPMYTPAPGIQRARIGTPPVISMRALGAALDAFSGISIDQLRAKSLALTSFAIDCADGLGVEVVTPREPCRRGSQVTLRLPHAYEVTQALIDRGVIGDHRAPDLLRLGFAPMYVRFTDVWDAMETLRKVLETEAWRDPAYARAGRPVT